MPKVSSERLPEWFGRWPRQTPQGGGGLQTPVAGWPRVSLVTPSFNQGAFVEDTILSVQNQGYFDLEYFVMDGGSTDRTREILEMYSDRLTFWESTPDRGQAHAINKGWRRATGKYLWWLNSDDMLAPGALHDAVEYLETHPETDLVYGDQFRIDADGQPVGLRSYPGFDFIAFELGRPDVSQAGALMRADVLGRIGYLDETLHYLMDLDYWRRMALAGCKLDHLDRRLALFRVYDEAKTLAGSPIAAQERAVLHERLFASAGLPAEILREGPRVASRMHLYRARTFILCGDYRAGLHETRLAATAWAGQLLRREFWYQGGLSLLGMLIGQERWRKLRGLLRRARGGFGPR